MRKVSCGVFVAAALALGGTTSPSARGAVVVFSDDFEGGLGNWVQAPAGTNPNMTIATDQKVSGTQSVKSTASGSRIYHNLGQEVSNAGGFTATFHIFDDSMTRTFAVHG